MSDVEKQARELFVRLSGQDLMARYGIIEQLKALPEEVYFPLLAEALGNHGDANTRNASMEVFRTLGESAVGPLTRLIKDNDEEVRMFSANLLGDIMSPGGVGPLVQGLEDPDVNVRIACAEALGKIKDSQSMDPLIQCLNDEPWVAMAAIKSLGEIGGEKCLKALYSCLELDAYKEYTLEAIEMAGDRESVECIAPMAKEGSMWELALKAVVNISEREGIRPDPEFFSAMVPRLIELQSAPNEEIRKVAIKALCWSEDPRGLEVFIEALTQEGLQEYAIEGIFCTGRTAFPALFEALQNPDFANRGLVSEILFMLDRHEDLASLHADTDMKVRVTAALSLAMLKTSDADALLTCMLDDLEEEVREAARTSLKQREKEK